MSRDPFQWWDDVVVDHFGEICYGILVIAIVVLIIYLTK